PEAVPFQHDLETHRSGQDPLDLHHGLLDRSHSPLRTRCGAGSDARAGANADEPTCGASPRTASRRMREHLSGVSLPFVRGRRWLPSQSPAARWSPPAPRLSVTHTVGGVHIEELPM